MGKRVAILFYGLTRSLKDIYNNLKENLFNELTKNNFEYDIFIHTYILDNSYKNPWSGESVKKYDNNAFKILNPKDFILQKQSLIEARLNIPQYFKKIGNWKGCASTPKMYCYLLRNMVLALHSKKKVVQLFAKYNKMNKYDYVIITRPDQYLDTKINTDSFNLLANNNIIIPFEHSYHGLNDRFCIAKPNVAIKYGLGLNKLKLYTIISPVVSEEYMKFYLTSIGVDIIYSPIKTHLVRC